MEAIRQQIAQWRSAFGRLSQKEQLTALSGASGACLLLLLIIGLMLSSGISSTKHRLKKKSEQLSQVIQLEGEYKAKQAAHKSRLRKLEKSNLRLVSLVEDVAKEIGVEIGQLRPDDGEPNADGLYESRVALKAGKLSIDRLEKFLNKIEQSKGLVIIDSLKVTKPYRKETLDIEMSLRTLKLKRSGS
tara:strand:+ start:34 stop:597 length:564 start_codon:yes stop_codon:yes gene_type:complete